MYYSILISANETEGNVYLNVLKESILGKLLVQLDEYDTRHDVVMSYLSDYVHMVYHAYCEEEQAVSLPLRKHAYSNTRKILPAKNSNFSDKKF